MTDHKVGYFVGSLSTNLFIERVYTVFPRDR